MHGRQAQLDCMIDRSFMSSIPLEGLLQGGDFSSLGVKGSSLLAALLLSLVLAGLKFSCQLLRCFQLLL